MNKHQPLSLVYVPAFLQTCDICRVRMPADGLTAHIRQTHTASYDARMASLHEAAARYRARVASR